MKKRTFNNLSVNSDSSNGKDPESNKCFRKDGTDLCTSTSSTPAFVEQRINLSTKQLWVEEAVKLNGIQAERVPREHNFADVFTHEPSESWRRQGMAAMSYEEVDENVDQ